MRDIEDLMLRTLKNLIVTTTTIPSGNIFIKNPPPEYNKHQDGPNTTATNNSRYPLVVIKYNKDAKIEPNPYGNSRFVNISSGMVTEYKPMAEMKLFLGIHLFTHSRADQKKYGAELYTTLYKNRLVTLVYDEIQGEYMGLNFKGMKDGPVTDPFHKVIFVDCCSRMFDEVTGYTIKVVETLVSADSVSGAFVSVNYNDDNPLAVDTNVEFGEGTSERTTTA